MQFMKGWALGSLLGCIVMTPLVVQGEESSVLLPSIPTVEIEQPLHFTDPEDADVLIQPGFYEVTTGPDRVVLTSGDDSPPILVQAQSMEHQEDLAEPYAFLEPGEEDFHHLLLLLPGGKGWEATGSVSGIQSRALARKRTYSGFKLQKAIAPPVIKSVFTTPQLLTLTPNGTLYIKGEKFGTQKGIVFLNFPFPSPYQPGGVKRVTVSIESWKDTAIKVQIPGLRYLYGVPDQRVGIYVRTARNSQSRQQPILFKQLRRTEKLEFNDPAITRACSSGGDNNLCDPHNPILNPWKVRAPKGYFVPEPFSLFGYHKNTDTMVDVDDGVDKFHIVLRNGWVFKDFEAKQKLHDDNGWIKMPSGEYLNGKLRGGSEGHVGVPWKLSPGQSTVAYGYHVRIEGPAGIPHFCPAGQHTCRCKDPHLLWNPDVHPDPFSRECFKLYCTKIGDRTRPGTCDRLR